MRAAIGLDVGTTAVKALAVDETGAVLARSELGYPLSTPQPGWAEQDPADWWRASEQALAALGVDDVAGIGLTGQMHGLVVLDAGGDVIRPAILWNDGRTAAECAEIEERIGLEELIARTGNRALPGFTAPKLLWLRRHEPDAYRRIARIALPKDYVRLRLCGEHAIDVADASGTLLLDVAQRRWSEHVIEALELDPAWLPPVLESPAVSGVTRERRPRRRRRRRPGRRGARRRRRSARAALDPARDERRGVRGAAGLRRRRARARARVLPRRAGRLARDGRDALRRRLAALAARRRRARRGVRRAGRRGGGAGRPAPRG